MTTPPVRKSRTTDTTVDKWEESKTIPEDVYKAIKSAEPLDCWEAYDEVWDNLKPFIRKVMRERDNRWKQELSLLFLDLMGENDKDKPKRIGQKIHDLLTKDVKTDTKTKSDDVKTIGGIKKDLSEIARKHHSKTGEWIVTLVDIERYFRDLLTKEDK